MRLSQWLPLPILTLLSTTITGSSTNYSTWMADSIISRGQGIAPEEPTVSTYLQIGIVQSALLRLIDAPFVASDCTKDDYRAYVRRGSESVLGKLLNASQDISYPLDRFSLGRGLLAEYYDEGNRTVKSALDALNESIALQPRNQYGGLWYFTYPNWSYLDGMYSYTSFTSLYTTHFDPPAPNTATDAFQLDLLWSHCYDNTSGLLFHGYDASKTAVWADPVTGASPIVWGRALGWYFMALVDWLDLNSFQPDPLQWGYVHRRFVALADAIANVVDPVSGAWWQVLNFAGREGNYIESSASAMFTYGLYKGVRLGYLPASRYRETANKAYEYLVNTFVVKNQNGTLGWNGTVSVCSLNSTASYEYYVTQPLLFNSVHGSASFVLASLENEMAV
ncbi:cell wall glycosyl hydrolase YteR, putative [Talaromyces stipitatus ATCC 10500]|uniref:Cell wall glycosyl hydrolase YteR, putative n=1 Tax=Talaromyces stipitatus (strain ATCC 10500 / CBS 375.48 / QM 6759 / NRRL 1006) TaxID=441959 RepID=B8MBG7_TALSN|nr:cell wall glycosyl hydrolase YteR, putative [Talaromyces stipitatus ATCC 10500]EED17831.1 cell wall glycosyl hydrolase YteR, putative [Talaromyces stipitatus ATCC 10500]